MFSFLNTFHAEVKLSSSNKRTAQYMKIHFPYESQYQYNCQPQRNMEQQVNYFQNPY